MNLKAFFTMPLAFLMMLLSLAFPPKLEQGIAVVYVSHGGGLAPRSQEYKIDLARENLWQHDYNGFLRVFGLPASTPRDENAWFEGFNFAGRLKADKIAAFRAAAETYGFDSWEGEYKYDGDPPTDLPGWSIQIVFADGTVKESFGYCAYPAHWAEMEQAFEALTGRQILRFT